MKKYSYNLSTLTNGTANSYYILGAFLSDGWIKKSGKNSFSSCLGSKDKEWIESIKDLFDPNIKIQTNKDNFYYFALNNKEIGEWFIEHDCVPNKSLSLRLPNITDSYMPDLIRGIFDGDGTLSIYCPPKKKYKHYVSYICSSSLGFLQDIKLYLSKTGIEGKIYLQNKKPHLLNGKEITPKHPHWRLVFNKSQTLKFLSVIYYDNHRLSLKRKLLKFQQMKDLL